MTDEEVETAAAGRGGRGGAGAQATAAPAGAPGAAAPTPAAQAPAAGGRAGRGAPPAVARNVPLDWQERYDNLVFPRGGGPGSLAGRGGAPDARMGEQVFRQTCAQCHRFGTLGKDYAPDLTSIAERAPRRDILRSIFFPNEHVDPKYATTVIGVKDGSTIRGLVVSETPQDIVLKTRTVPEPVTVPKAQVATRTTEPVSIMPPDLPDTVTDNGVRDVTAYIMRTMQ